MELADLHLALQELSELRRILFTTTQLDTVSRACQNVVEYCTTRADPFLDGFASEGNPWKKSATPGRKNLKEREISDLDLIPSIKRSPVICLAAPESGFDEILRRISTTKEINNNNNNYNNLEIEECRHYMKQNLLSVLRVVSRAAGSDLLESNQRLHKKLQRDFDGTNFDGELTPAVADSLKSLWSDPAVQHYYSSILSSYFVKHHIGPLTIDGVFNLVDRLQDPAFVPTPNEFSHSFTHATGVREALIPTEEPNVIQLLDLTNLPVVGEGEFCNERWVSQFQNCSFIFCYVPIHTYDEKICHDSDSYTSSPVVSDQSTTPTNSQPTTPTASPSPSPNRSIPANLQQPAFIPAHLRAHLTRSTSKSYPVKTRSISLRHFTTKPAEPNNNNNSNNSNNSNNTNNNNNHSSKPISNAPNNSTTTPTVQPTKPIEIQSSNESKESKETKEEARPLLSVRSVSQASINASKFSVTLKPLGDPTKPYSPSSSPSLLSTLLKEEKTDTSEQKPSDDITSPNNINNEPNSSHPIGIPSSSSKIDNDGETNQNDKPPNQIIGFSLSESPATSARKSVYRQSKSLNSLYNSPQHFERRKVQSKQTKPSHIAASHRLHLPSTSSSSSSSPSPSFTPAHSPNVPPLTNTNSFLNVTSTSPSRPIPPMPLSPTVNKSNNDINNSNIKRGDDFRASIHSPLLPPPPRINRKSAMHNQVFVAPPSPSSSSSSSPPPSPSIRRSHYGGHASTSYGQLSPLSFVSLPASPTLADIFKLPCFLKRFSSLVNSEYLVHVSVVVTFVTSSEFSKKIQEVDLDLCFPEYEGDHTEQSAVAYIQKKFEEQNANPSRKILTCVLNASGGGDPTSQIKTILKDAASTPM